MVIVEGANRMRSWKEECDLISDHGPLVTHVDYGYWIANIIYKHNLTNLGLDSNTNPDPKFIANGSSSFHFAPQISTNRFLSNSKRNGDDPIF
jgi:hypothetical protein